MYVDEAFDIFQRKVNADPIHVQKARHRRDIFSEALRTLGDVAETIPSGSLARGTQLDPIHDVDLIVTFSPTAHPEWGKPGNSAEQALEFCQEQVRKLLGDQSPIFQNVVGQTTLRNHVVECLLDPRFLAKDSSFRGSFAVEVMPALRTGDALLVPERKERDWQTVDPEWLITEVRRHQKQWQYFVRAIRVIKFWMRYVNSGVKPLAAEVLGLQCLPDSLTSDFPRSTALLRFFTAAAPTVMLPVTDPAGHCGEIQPELRRTRVSALLREASDMAATAVYWEQEGEHHKAICSWRAVFGETFPMPPGGCPGSGGGNGGSGYSSPTDGGGPGSRRIPEEGGGSGDSADYTSGGSGGADPPGMPPGGDSGEGGSPPPGPKFAPFVPGPPRRRVKDAPQG